MKFHVKLKVRLGDTGASSPAVARLLYHGEAGAILQRIFGEARIWVNGPDIEMFLRPRAT